MKHICLATEDELSECVGLRLIREVTSTDPPLKLRKNGAGYLRSSIRKFCQLAKQQPLLLITDLDRVECPALLMSDWLGGQVRPRQLLFRVAVREIESWLLADSEGIAEFLGISAQRVASQPEAILDPKKYLLDIVARAARREIRVDMLPEFGSLARTGLGYNSRLLSFVKSEWNPERASMRSRSLRQLRKRLYDLHESLQ